MLESELYYIVFDSTQIEVKIKSGNDCDTNMSIFPKLVDIILPDSSADSGSNQFENNLLNITAHEIFRDEPNCALLLHLGGLNYMYIYDEIYTFSAESNIVEFCSRKLGEITYSYAKDEKNRYYLLDESIIVNWSGKFDQLYTDCEPHNVFYCGGQQGSAIFEFNPSEPNSEYAFATSDPSNEYHSVLLNKFNIQTFYFGCTGQGECIDYTLSCEPNCTFNMLMSNIICTEDYKWYNEELYSGIYMKLTYKDDLVKMTEEEFDTILSDFCQFKDYKIIDRNLIFSS